PICSQLVPVAPQYVPTLLQATSLDRAEPEALLDVAIEDLLDDRGRQSRLTDMREGLGIAFPAEEDRIVAAGAERAGAESLDRGDQRGFRAPTDRVVEKAPRRRAGQFREPIL